MKKGGFAFVLLTLLLFASGIQASACDRVTEQFPIRIELEDGSKVFYFNARWQENGYPQTGLYYNTEPLEKIYLVDDIGAHTMSCEFFFSNNLRYLAIVSHGGSGRVASFYRNGVLIRYYTRSDLMRDQDAVLRFCSSSSIWVLHTEFNARRNRLTITARDDMTHRFNIRTGRIIRDRGAITALKFIALISTTTVWFVKGQRREAK